MIRVSHNPPPRPTWRKRLFWIGGALIVVLSLASASFAVWALAIPEPMHTALLALESTAEVTVTTDTWYSFAPALTAPRKGLIFYPGGRVDARAYSPVAHAIAEAGYLVVIVPMPLNLAVLAPGSARAVMAAHPTIEEWYLAGHSLGGAMTANYVYANRECCAGLILWAAYPAENNSLADHSTLNVMSIYGTRDGLATQAQILESQARLPPAARFVPIAGGNHAQFGWYGDQDGDNSATIDRQEQQRQAVEATLQLMQAED
ncbi:MAG: alpha/beta hydrolase [Litorilinea sp.]